MKKLKFLLSSLVFLLIVLACGQVNATEAPIRIYNKYDLYDFIVAYGGSGSATIDGDKVILNKNITATTEMYFPSNIENPYKCEDITLDLNGNYIYFNTSDNHGIWWNSSDHNLTITGKADSNNDYIRTTKGNALYTGVTKNILVENISLITDSSSESAFKGYQLSNTKMKNVELKSNLGGAILEGGMTVDLENVKFNLGNSTCQYGVKVNSGNVTLNNCEYDSSYGSGNLVWITSESAHAVINGGTYNYEGGTSNYLLNVENGTLQINDGTFTNKYGTALRITSGTTTINGGTFDGRDKTITTAGDATLILRGGYIKARTQFANKQGAAIAFSMSKTVDSLVGEGYFATDTSKTTGDGFSLSGPEISVYAKPGTAIFDKKELTYNGNNQAPSVIVKDIKGNTLQYGTDYTVQYPTDRKNVGEYKAKVVFIDRYESIPAQELSYKINKATYDMSKFKFENKKVTYNGKNQSITATGIPAGLKVTYLNNNKKKVGIYSIVAHFEVDTKNYNPIQDKIATLTIVPKGTSISKLKAGKKQFKATWKKQKTQTTGYEIQYSTNSKFKSGNKKVKIKKNKTTSTTVKKLKGKKKYYVRVRTYKTVNGKKIYSDWSKSKKVTTKK